MSFLADVSAAELAARMAATALVVIAVAFAVGRFGPLVGGALAGLPIVLGPGFYFLIQKSPPGFVAEAAAFAVLSLCATQAFLLAYIVAASRASSIMALVAAASAWIAVALSLRPLPADPILGTVLFVGLTLGARTIAVRFRRAATAGGHEESASLLLLRGGLAGLLVALVTAGAGRLGAEWSGLLLGFPIGFTAISVTLHERLGRDAVIATLHSALLGTASLVGFCATLALTLPRLAPHLALLAALTVSFGVTIGLLLRARSAKSTAS